MPKDIKIKTTIKNVKLLDKVASGTAHVKNAAIKSKEMAEHTQDSGHASPNEYATGKAAGGAKNIAGTAAHKFKNPRAQAKKNINRAKERFIKARQQLPKARRQAAEQAKKAAETAKANAKPLKEAATTAKKTSVEAQKAYQEAKIAARDVRQAGKQTVQTARQGVRTGRQAEKTIKTAGQSAKATDKGAVKTAKKSVKTAQRSANVTVKTAHQAAKTAEKSARAAAKSAKIAEKTFRQAAKAAEQTAKAAARAVTAMVKAAIAAVQGLIAIIAAGGWVVILIILIICMIGLLIGSIFGIFFSGEDSGTGCTMPDVVAELTTEFYDKIEQIENDNPHDVTAVDAVSINWKEVLAVYAVKVTTDPDDAMDVATLDDDKIDKLRGVLNDMVSLSYSLRTDTRERTVTDDDGNEYTESVEITTLIITLNQKSVGEMVAEYGFSSKQKDNLHELLSPKYDDLWVQLLGGYSNGSGEIRQGSGSHIPRDMFDWPMAIDYPITSRFGYRKDPFTGETKYHGGIDLGAPGGAEILAMAEGTVIKANATDSYGGGYGYYVIIQHDGGYQTVYAHCSKVAVSYGQQVAKGQVIAYVGTTGKSTGNHLHFEVRKDGTRVNPLNYFG